MFLYLKANYGLLFFIFLAAIKGIMECWASRQGIRMGNPQKQCTSIFFIILGLLPPILIPLEILLPFRTPPMGINLTFTVLILLVWGIRIYSILLLGKNYSVDIRTDPDQVLIHHGIYRIIRHPIYMVAILESLFYPLGCGSYKTALILFLLGTPVILLRRNMEEKVLLEYFGEEYRDYKKKTFF